MSEMQHPEAEIPQYDVISAERYFAQTAQSMLQSFGALVTEYIFDAENTRTITQRVGLTQTEEQEAEGIEQALRVVQTPA